METRHDTGRKAVVLLSGGLDSMVVAGLAAQAGYSVHALTIDYNQRHRRELDSARTIDYNQRHRRELDSARTIAAHLGAARHVILPLDLRQFGGSALTDDIAVPKAGAGLDGAGGEGGGGKGGDIPITYVPARNLVFLSLTLAWAEALGALDIFIGVNALDYSGYPDCRPEFIAGFADLAALATKAGDGGGRFTIHAPLQYMGKAEIVREAARLGLDPGMSWSCYDPQTDGRACGLCDSCRLRQAGFAEAGMRDPTVYAA